MRWLVLILLAACAAETPVPALAPETKKVELGHSAPQPTPTPTTTASEPLPPEGLQRWLTGSAKDATPSLPAGALLFMGGGPDVDAAFSWASARAPNGDVVVLRASGADGYNDYLYTDIGGFDSVETLMVTTKALADDPYVAWRVEQAEIVFMAGGAQDVYLREWTGTKLAAAVTRTFDRGALVGGTSAGAMTSGDPVFAACNGSVTSAEALADPLHPAIELAPGPFGLIGRTIVDTHFSERDRLGRLVAFLARAYTSPVWGVGVDEETALVLEVDGSARLFGVGAAHVLYADHAPAPLVTQKPVTYRHLKYRALAAPAAVSQLFDAAALSGEVDCIDGKLQ